MQGADPGCWWLSPSNMFVDEFCLHVLVPMKSRRHQISSSWNYRHCEFWEVNPGPLEEQFLLLTTEPSLQAHLTSAWLQILSAPHATQLGMLGALPGKLALEHPSQLPQCSVWIPPHYDFGQQSNRALNLERGVRQKARQSGSCVFP